MSITHVPEDFDRLPATDRLETDQFTVLRCRSAATTRGAKVVLNRLTVVFVRRGTKIVQTPEDRFEIAEGCGAVLPRGACIMRERLANGAFESLAICLRDEEVRALISRVRISPADTNHTTGFVPVPFPIANTPLFQGYIESLIPYFETADKPLNPHLLRLKFEELVFNLLDSKEGAQFAACLAGSSESPDRKIRDCLEQLCFHPLSLSEMAHLSGVSLSSFRRACARLYNEAPSTWIRRRRLGRARALLTGGDLTIAEIAGACGFESPSHFIHLFRTQEGVTPGTFREQRRELRAS